MSSNLSRRTFLKGLGAGAASIAAMGVVGVPVMENAAAEVTEAAQEAVEAVGEDEVEYLFFDLFMGSIHKEVVQGSEHGDVAVALESLRDYAAEYLLLEIYLTLGDYNADKYTLAHN